MLEVLRSHHVLGTFFVVGSMAAEHPELIRELRDSGAEIGIHTFTHPDLGVISHSGFEHEISETRLAIAGAAGITSYRIRPPYSSTPDAVANAGMRTIRDPGALGSQGPDRPLAAHRVRHRSMWTAGSTTCCTACSP